MKQTILLLAICLIVTTESRGQRQAGNEELITVDVTKSYSTIKELILQDFMDVEYIALETNDDFLNQGLVMDIGKKIIIVANRINDGDIFIYDRSGKAIRKINHKGALASREYTQFLGITLDEDNNEMFVNDPSIRRILVYDLLGKFKRSFKHSVESTGNPFNTSYYTEIFNYDKNNLICYAQNNDKSKTFVLISKKDGSITNEIKIPCKEHISLIRRTGKGPEVTVVSPGLYRTIIPFKSNWMLLELSSDTVYTFLPDYNLRPFLVRTPSIQSMSSKIFLLLSLFTDRYYFMEIMRDEFDWNTRTGFPRTPLLYDRQEKAFFKYTVYNGDYSTKKEVYLNKLRPVNHEIIESWQTIEAFELVEDYKKGLLKEGKLREIASTLDEEDNPVIMLIKHKK